MDRVREYKHIGDCDLVARFYDLKVEGDPNVDPIVKMENSVDHITVYAPNRRKLVLDTAVVKAIVDWANDKKQFEMSNDEYWREHG